MSKKVKLIIFVFSFLALLWVANFALAANFGINEVNNSLNGALGSMTDPRIIAGRIIQIALGFLGIIAVVLIIYAGFLWMTSGGDEEKVTKAKKTLKNGIIGLIIILSSWAVTTFLLSKLLGAIDIGGGNLNGGSGFINSGVGAVGACTVDSFYPVNNQKEVPRNTSIMVTFKEEIKLDSVCIDGSGGACACNNQPSCNKVNPLAVRLFKTEMGDNPSTNLTDIQVSVPSGAKTLVLTPLSPLGSNNINTPYSIKLTNQIKKLDGTSMFRTCSADYAQWEFEVNTSFDLTPPQVVQGKIFPMPDNEKDIFREVTAAVAAQGTIKVSNCPQVYSPAQVTGVSPVGNSPAGAEATLDYHGPLTKLIVYIPESGNGNKAQLFNGEDESILLGVSDIDAQGVVVFNGYLTFKSVDHPVASKWLVNISPERLADTLTIGSMVYAFATSSANNNILVDPNNCIIDDQAISIRNKLTGRPDITAALNSNIISLTAKVAGIDGNNIIVSTTNPGALIISPMAGGVNRQELTQSRDKKDRPMNSVIQINFSEAVNPMTISGSATEVANYIRVVNANASSSPATINCSVNADCRSYKCENSTCVGDYLGGKFVVSNGYRTLEFISDKECGVNGCGEKIYCLPANSHLSVELIAADLKPCNNDSDCVAFNPFRSCIDTTLGYKTCQNPQAKNYPLANLNNLNGIVDAAINSFDGDRDIYSDGPLDFYNDNYQPAFNVDKKDKYKWSFYINDKIALDPPQITFLSPSQGQASVGPADLIQINFNILMMNSTLRTGSTLINNGTSTFEHKLINLHSSSVEPLGYWILNDNLDTAPLDGEPDLTIAKIYHSTFGESLTYKAQVGSGVKDIYQNCYKPSVGPGCSAIPDKPSCCFGVITDTLGPDGNCP